VQLNGPFAAVILSQAGEPHKDGPCWFLQTILSMNWLRCRSDLHDHPQKKKMVTRRRFSGFWPVGAAGLAVEYGESMRIVGANDRLNLRDRAERARVRASSSLKANSECRAVYRGFCDVDGNILKKFADAVAIRELVEGARGGERLRAIPRTGRRGRHHDCHSRPLAFSMDIAGCNACKHSTWKTLHHTPPRERCCWRRSKNIKRCNGTSSALRHTHIDREKLRGGCSRQAVLAKRGTSNLREVSLAPQ